MMLQFLHFSLGEEKKQNKLSHEISVGKTLVKKAATKIIVAREPCFAFDTDFLLM